MHHVIHQCELYAWHDPGRIPGLFRATGKYTGELLKPFPDYLNVSGMYLEWFLKHQPSYIVFDYPFLGFRAEDTENNLGWVGYAFMEDGYCLKNDVYHFIRYFSTRKKEGRLPRGYSKQTV